MLHIESFDDIRFGAQETKSKEDELCREELLGTRDFLHLPTSTAVLGPFDADYIESGVSSSDNVTTIMIIPVLRPWSFPSSSTTKSLVEMQYSLGSVVPLSQ